MNTSNQHLINAVKSFHNKPLLGALQNKAKTNNQEKIKDIWLGISTKYREDAYGFAYDILKERPTIQQIDILRAISIPGAKVTVTSGTGTGKTRLSAVIAIWLFVCYSRSATYATSPKFGQLKKGFWKEVRDCYERLVKEYPIFGSEFTINEDILFKKGKKDSHFIQIETAKDDKAQSIAGRHAEWQTFIVDEASEVSEKIFEALEGNMTGEFNRMIMFSQMTKLSGTFYDSHNINRGQYYAFNLSSEESRLVKMNVIKDKIIRYGGRNTPAYGTRMLGLANTSTGDHLFSSRSDFEFICTNKSVTHKEAWGWVLIADPSEGKPSGDATGYLIAKVSGDYLDRVVEVVQLEEVRGMGPVKIVNYKIKLDYFNEDYTDITVGFDAVGLGAGTVEACEEANIDFEPIKWGKKAFDQELYKDQKTEAYHLLKRAITKKNVIVPPTSKNPYTRQLLDELSKIPNKLSLNGGKNFVDKEEIRKTHGISPNLADCIAMAMIVPYRPFYADKSALDLHIDKSLQTIDVSEYE